MARWLSILILLASPSLAAPIDDAAELREIRWLLVRWRQAWEGKDLPGMLACYAERFTSDGLDRAAFAEQKRRVFERAGSISVQMADIAIERDGARATLRYRQTYRSDRHQDRGRKTLTLVKEVQGWRIAAESFEPE